MLVYEENRGLGFSVQGCGSRFGVEGVLRVDRWGFSGSEAGSYLRLIDS